MVSFLLFATDYCRQRLGFDGRSDRIVPVTGHNLDDESVAIEVAVDIGAGVRYMVQTRC